MRMGTLGQFRLKLVPETLLIEIDIHTDTRIPMTGGKGELPDHPH